MKTVYMVACILLAFAIVLKLVALNTASRRARIIASAAERRAESDEPPDEEARAEVLALARTSRTTTGVSLLLAIAGIGLACYSFARGYRKLTAIPVVLLVVYVVVFLL